MSVAGVTRPLFAMVSGGQAISSSVLLNISGLSLALAASGIYDIYSRLMYTVSVANAVGFGVSGGASTVGASFRWMGPAGPGQAVGSLASFNEVGFGSITISIAVNTASALNHVVLFGTFHASAAATFQMMARTSVTTNLLTIRRGSFLRAFRIA